MKPSVNPKYASKIDARRLFNKVKKYHPVTVELAHEILANFLKEYDYQKYKIFIGLEDERKALNGLSHVRFQMVFVHLDICRHLEYVEKENLSEWNEISLDWLLRKLLNMPYRVIEGGKPKDD